ncbi:hypothetical protein HDU91_003026, partial [Kappamyces sp. JEL0680]
LSDIPTVIVQGRYDVVCPMTSAWELKKKMPHAELIVTHAGHSATEADTTAELVKAADTFASL